MDFNLFGHQIVAHRSDTPPKDHFNPVDGDDVPVPHLFVIFIVLNRFHSFAKFFLTHLLIVRVLNASGCVLSWDGFDRLAERLKEHNVKVIDCDTIFPV